LVERSENSVKIKIPKNAKVMKPNAYPAIRRQVTVMYSARPIDSLICGSGE
jgi:hypothetical protein